MNELCLVPIGPVPPQAMEWIENATAEWFPLPIRRLAALPIPPKAYDATRQQYWSVEIMKLLSETTPRERPEFSA